MVGKSSKELTIIENDINESWSDLLNRVREDLALVWSDKAKEDLSRIKSDAEKIDFILRKCNNGKKLHADVARLLKHIKRKKATKSWVKKLYKDLKAIISETERSLNSIGPNVSRRNFVEAGLGGIGLSLVPSWMKKAMGQEEKHRKIVISKTRPVDTFRVQIGAGWWTVEGYNEVLSKNFGKAGKDIPAFSPSKGGKGPLIVLYADLHVDQREGQSKVHENLIIDLLNVGKLSRDFGLNLMFIEGWLGTEAEEKIGKRRNGETDLLTMLIEQGDAKKFKINLLGLEEDKTQLRMLWAGILWYHYEVLRYERGIKELKTKSDLASNFEILRYQRFLDNYQYNRDESMKELGIEFTAANIKKIEKSLAKYLHIDALGWEGIYELWKHGPFLKVVKNDRDIIFAKKIVDGLHKQKMQQCLVFVGTDHIPGIIREVKKLIDCDFITIGPK